MNWTPVLPDDLHALIKLGLVQMRDEVPVLTDEGERAGDDVVGDDYRG
jgi:hypothetical protein